MLCEAGKSVHDLIEFDEADRFMNDCGKILFAQRVFTGMVLTVDENWIEI